MSDLYNLKKGVASLSDLKDGFLSAGIPVGMNSNVFFVDPANGSDGNEGTIEAPLASIETAEDRCEANQNDVVAYIAGSSKFDLTAALTWDKNYTHLIGICAPTETAQRARIFQTSTLKAASPLLNITASGCIFKNFYIFQGVDDATSLINVQVTGGRNYFGNVHFAGGGHATQAINGGASLELNGAEENTFVGCTIGVDTVDAATGMMGLLFDTDAHRNVFRDCIFRMRAGNSGAGFIEVVDSDGIGRDNTFVDCIFVNNSTSNDMASAVVAPAGMGESKAQVLLFKDCMFHNVTAIDANDRGVVFGNMNAITGADGSGVAVQLVSS